MTRVFKFRVWDSLKKEMYYSKCHSNDYEFGIDNKGIYCITYDSIVSTRTIEKNRNIMQYTSLKDKNGNDIYEGDIIKVFDKIESETTVNIIFHNGAFHFFNNLDGTRIACLFREVFLFCEISEDFMEIIGNIHQNPYLLDK